MIKLKIFDFTGRFDMHARTGTKMPLIADQNMLVIQIGDREIRGNHLFDPLFQLAQIDFRLFIKDEDKTCLLYTSCNMLIG